MKIFNVKKLVVSKSLTNNLYKNTIRWCSSVNESNFQNDQNYQFLSNTKIPMLHFQPSLLRLPIPDLDKTCERYLTSLKPLIDDANYNRTNEIVKNFKNSIGGELQNLLKKHDLENKHTSYVSKPWFDMYLSDRQPLPVNYNPVMIFNNNPKQDYNTQLLRTTNFIISALRFYRSLKSKTLEPEVFHLNPKKSDTERFRNILKFTPSFISTYVAYTFKAYPLDMSQYGGLFGKTRIPKEQMDYITGIEDSRHLIILKGGHFYSIDVLDENDNILPPENILRKVNQILNDNRPEAENPLGVLTSEDRNVWAKVRKHLENLGNHEQLKKIDNALFCLCLDDSKMNENDQTVIIKDLLYGNPTNRWFDKSLSLIVTKDGTSAVNFEHSWGDGVAVLRFFNEIYKDSLNKPYVHPTDEKKLKSNNNFNENSVELLKFNLDETIVNSINTAIEKHSKITNSLDLRAFKENGIGRDFCKKYSVSPDSFMQLSFQLAFYKQNKKFVATYESCSTAAFRHGRTETIRPCTIETSEFCKKVSLTNNRPSNAELREMIDKCSKVHSNLTKEAAMGQGFDRHLFGLKHIAKLNNIENLDIFNDSSYKLMNHNIISTSTLSSPALLAGGFGPVVNDGYGVAYNINNAFAGVIVTNYKEKRDGNDFIKCIDSAFQDIKEIIVAFPPKK